VSYLTAQPLDLSALYRRVQSPERGGTASFIGTVRNHHQGREVLCLDYQAYAPMADAECARIQAETESRWQVAVALQHRTGRLEIGDVAVAVVVAAAHRDDAFVACRHVIEELKRRVPIWKREVFADGSTEWVGAAGQRASGANASREAENLVLESHNG
jgi:molybdopterin synthase catalytic subunit